LVKGVLVSVGGWLCWGVCYNCEKPTHSKKHNQIKQATLVDPARKLSGLLYTGPAGPHRPGYQIAGSPVSCRQLEADAVPQTKPQEKPFGIKVRSISRCSIAHDMLEMVVPADY